MTAKTCETAETSTNTAICETAGTSGILGPSGITGPFSNSRGEADDMIEPDPSNLRDGEVTMEVGRNYELISANNSL